MSENTNISKSVEIMRKISSKEFSGYFYKNIMPKLVQFEKKRIRARIFGYAVVFFIAAAVISLFLTIINIINFFTGFVLCAAAIAGCVVCTALSNVKLIQRQMKSTVLPLLLNFISGGWSVSPYCNNKNFSYRDSKYFDINTRCRIDNATMEDVAEFNSILLFDSFNICRIDDRITGNYNSFPVVLRDIKLEEIRTSTEARNHSAQTIFKGLLMKFPPGKNFECRVVVRKNNHGVVTSGNIDTDLTRVHLEDPVFEKYFNVYSDNQVEARYVLTTGFMDRLVNIAAKNKNCDVSCSFLNGYMYLALGGKDWFDIDEKKSFKEMANWQKILVDFVEIFRIIDELKINQNIGM